MKLNIGLNSLYVTENKQKIAKCKSMRNSFRTLSFMTTTVFLCKIRKYNKESDPKNSQQNGLKVKIHKIYLCKIIGREPNEVTVVYVSYTRISTIQSTQSLRVSHEILCPILNLFLSLACLNREIDLQVAK